MPPAPGPMTAATQAVAVGGPGPCRLIRPYGFNSTFRSCVEGLPHAETLLHTGVRHVVVLHNGGNTALPPPLPPPAGVNGCAPALTPILPSQSRHVGPCLSSYAREPGKLGLVLLALQQPTPPATEAEPRRPPRAAPVVPVPVGASAPAHPRTDPHPRGANVPRASGLVPDSAFCGYMRWWRGGSGARGQVLGGGVTGTAKP